MMYLGSAVTLDGAVCTREDSDLLDNCSTFESVRVILVYGKLTFAHFILVLHFTLFVKGHKFDDQFEDLPFHEGLTENIFRPGSADVLKWCKIVMNVTLLL